MMNQHTYAFLIKCGQTNRAARMQVTLDWAARHFDRHTFDRFTKNGRGGRIGWMRKPMGYPANGLPWHEVRGHYLYPQG